MKFNVQFLVILFITLSYSPDDCAQGINTDSLQRAIMKSLQHQMDLKHVSKSLFDTSRPWSSYSPINLKKLLEGIDKEISTAKSSGDIGKVSRGYSKLSSLDSSRGNYKGAYENYRMYAMYQDSLRKKELEKKELEARMQRDFDKKQAQQQLEREREHRKNLIRQIVLYAILLAFIIFSASFFAAYKRERKRKKLLNLKNQEIENTLSELRSTQAQLIQSEKMASLGELTAGIAHEIQNPLNFVNNFSEVNHELIDELKTELVTGNGKQATDLANNIQDNEEKIIFHGKRADAIVKSMLQHSRASTGKKELTDINELVDEYMRLAYHGMRAKDKSFNVTLKTEYDQRISKISIVPQDIGRVILNLLTNAFYAVTQTPKDVEPSFEPTVTVKTKLLKHPDDQVARGMGVADREVAISIADNGAGIPKKILDKIFQPFFTTKPSGKGTGLGLSLSYDIVKAHGGELKVNTEEGKYTEFIILLPQ